MSPDERNRRLRLGFLPSGSRSDESPSAVGQ